jgi:hypothetical protein
VAHRGPRSRAARDLLTLPAREQVYLPLTAAPFSAGIQVEDAKGARGHPEQWAPTAAHRNGTAIALQLGEPNVRQFVAALLALAAPECRAVVTTIPVPRARFLRQRVRE